MRSLIGLIIFLAILVFLIPFVMNTNWGKNQIERCVSSKYNCKLKIGQLSLSWFENQSAKDISVDKEDIHVTIKEITLNSTLFPLILKARHPEEIVFFGDLQIKDGEISRGTGKPSGHFSIKTTPENKVIIHADSFPPEILNGSLPLKEAIGSSFTSDATVTFTSKLYDDFQYNITFRAPRLSFISTGNYSHGTVTLSSPFKANFLLTEVLSHKIFTQSPIRPTSVKPMQITVYPDGTQIPLESFSWNNIIIPRMTIDLNQMLFKNFGTVAALLSIIQFNLRPNQDVNIWFQESPMQLKAGVLSFSRTEMLVDNKYQLGSWGNIDLSRKLLDMYVGITASTLREAFNITLIPDNYTIPVKVDGPISEPKVHKAEVTAIISGLLLLQTQAHSLPFTQIPATSPSPPARPPFPWK